MRIIILLLLSTSLVFAEPVVKVIRPDTWTKVERETYGKDRQKENIQGRINELEKEIAHLRAILKSISSK